jgi:hypothetical protein
MLLTLTRLFCIFIIGIMPTTDYSASRVTQLKNSVALASFKRSNTAAVNAGISVQREQPTYQLQTVVTQRNLASANTNPPASDSSPCGCTTPVFVNAGGC